MSFCLGSRITMRFGDALWLDNLGTLQTGRDYFPIQHRTRHEQSATPLCHATKKLSWSSQFSCFCALLKFSGVPAMRGLDTQRLIAGNTVCHLFVEAEQWSWIIGFQAASTLAKLSEDKNQKHLITEIQTLQNDSEANALMGVERIGRVPRENKNKANKDVSREGVKFLYWGLLETCLCRVL